MSSPAAGWFPDPLQRHEQRYWSGIAWTEHVSDGGRSGVDPMGPSQSPMGSSPVAAMAAVVPAAASAPVGERRNAAIVGGVIAALALAIVVVVVLLVRGGSDETAGTAIVAGPASTTSDSTIGEPGGPQIDIPAGAIPPTRDGDAADIVVAAERVGELPEVDTSNLPDGVTVSSESYRLSPIGQTFQTPVRVTLPIPSGMPADQVGGIAFLDESDGTWVSLDSIVDAAAGVVSAEMTHFTIVAPWSTSGPRMSGSGPPEPRRDTGGYIQIINPIRTGSFPSSAFPGVRQPQYGSMAQYYGLCVLDYQLDDPRLAEGASWSLGAPQGTYIDGRGNRERFGARLGVRSGPSTPNAPHTRWFWLPAGTYTFGEFWSGSEINPGNPLYVPIAAEAQRQVTLRVDDRGMYTFDERTTPFGRSNDLSDGWVPDRPGCFGPVAPTPRTGAIQITLNWPQTGVDLDLHVIDPNGDEIYYANKEVASGGYLDWDNTFGGGTPENVYWETGPPSGTYRVAIVYYSGSDPASWTVRVVQSGQVRSFNGTIRPGSGERTRVEVTTFQVP